MWPLVGMFLLAVAGVLTGFGERLTELIAVTAVAIAVSIWAQLEQPNA